jgi:DNA-binding winged helix-turn-helix (wHTH) protein/Flp pilus assembly protein TadD
MSSSPETVPPVVYRFDRFELLPDLGELRKRGTRLHIAPQPFRVLQLLIERAGEVVTREEIQEALWASGTFVDHEQGINTAIRRIRFVLNDNAETPRFLQTVPRRGYCFVAAVERVSPTNVAAAWLEATLSPPLQLVEPPAPVAAPWPPAEPQPRRRTSLVAAIAAAAVLLLAERGSHRAVEAAPAALRIAIAPLRIDPALAPALDPRRVSEELQTSLARVQPKRIRVVPPGARADLRIETTLQNAGDVTRAHVRLVDGRTGAEVWTEKINRKSGRADDFPIEIALRVTRAVTERYSPPPHYEPVLRTHVSPRALALYRQARVLRGGPAARSDLDGALAHFHKAVALEPRFAEAWSGIGNIWSERAGASSGEARTKAIAQARPAMERALRLDPRNVEALNDYARIVMMRDRAYAAAEIHLRRALEADPEYLPTYMTLALLQAAMGQNEQAIATFRRVQELAPAYHVPSPYLAYLYLMAQRPDDAMAEYHASLLTSRVPFVSHSGLMWSAIMAGRWEDAGQWLAAVLEEPVDLGNDPDRAASFRRELRRLEPKLLAREQTGRLDPYTMVVFYTACNENDLALAALDRAIAGESLNAIYAFVDPRLDALRSDPRLDARLQKLGFGR